MLVIRPILFCCLELVLQDRSEASHLTTSTKLRHIITVSSEAAHNMLSILSRLHEQGLLETFLPWDFDALFVSTTVLILIQFIDGKTNSSEADRLDDAFKLVEHMASCGNDVAAHRMHELHVLGNMLRVAMPVSGPQSDRQKLSHPAGDSRHMDLISEHRDCSAAALNGTRAEMGNGGIAAANAPMDGSGQGTDLTAEHILAMTDGMEIEENDWMSLLMFDANSSYTI